MKTFDLVILLIIIAGGWVALFSGNYNMSVNLFLAAAIISILYNKYD